MRFAWVTCVFLGMLLRWCHAASCRACVCHVVLWLAWCRLRFCYIPVSRPAVSISRAPASCSSRLLCYLRCLWRQSFVFSVGGAFAFRSEYPLLLLCSSACACSTTSYSAVSGACEKCSNQCLRNALTRLATLQQPVLAKRSDTMSYNAATSACETL